jgi:cytosine/adenosine deaminase-related metal-dependent hydrolase
MADTITYAARWVFPVDGPPLPRGSVTVHRDLIVSVQPAGQQQPEVDLGDVAILPGFVNAHTHLDLSGAHGRCPPTPDFTAWLRQVIAFRQQRTPEQVQQDIAAGIAACLLSGTTLVGDIAAGGASWDLLSRSPIRATVYYELIGLTRERAEQSWQEAERWLEAHAATETCRPGLSPHAPYSVRRELFEAVAERAASKESPLPVAIHLAETYEEIELLEHRSGSFVEFLRERGAWDPEGLVAGFEEVGGILHRIPTVALIHGHHFPPDWRSDWFGLSIIPPMEVICPRTTAAFGRGPRPLGELGEFHTLGTDSLASNPDLDILAEARFLYKRLAGLGEDPEPILLLYEITFNGARALSWAKEAGSLTPGKSADLVVLPLPHRDVAVPEELIFDSDLPVRSVMFRGRWVVGEEAAGKPAG